MIARLFCILIGFSGLWFAAQTSATNVILILTDDQGWTGSSVTMDSRVRGSVSDFYETPSLERLAAEGVRFSNGYAPAPNCSPTRMSIQTGKTPVRIRATDIIDAVPGPKGDVYGFYERFYLNKPLILPHPITELALEEVTIAEYLKAENPDYVTAHIGKWHMGGKSPELHGYDVHDGATSNAPGNQGAPDPKRSSEVADRAIGFLEAVAENDKPFFLQVSYYAVHTPVIALDETVAKYSAKSPSLHQNDVYAAMTEEMDHSVGRILDTVDELGFSDNTYIIYTSDNGAEVTSMTTSNAPLAKGKTHVWEGGIRVPFVVRGPGIPAGKQINTPVIGYDILPTIADWIGAKTKLPEAIDGGSFAALAAQGDGAEINRATEPMVWYYSAYRNIKHVAPQAAIRIGQHKLIRDFSSGEDQLFDLDLDVAETTDLSRFRPDAKAQLANALDQYFEDVNAELPRSNPDYDPSNDKGLVGITKGAGPTPR